MSFFDFVKNAGARVIESAGNAAGSILGHVRREVPDARTDDIDVSFTDGTVRVSGNAVSQEEKEKIILAAGNVHGVERIEDGITVSGEQAPASRMYTVKAGDTLSAIARAVYGNANEYPKIFEANKPMLKHPDRIYPGQVLRIP